jgi:hypothetical protein
MESEAGGGSVRRAEAVYLLESELVIVCVDALAIVTHLPPTTFDLRTH